MNLTDTLHDLHRIIQKAFEFDNDHLYAFYVGHGMMQETYVIDDAVTNGDESGKDPGFGDYESRGESAGAVSDDMVARESCCLSGEISTKYVRR